MESPATVVKAAINPSSIIRFAVGSLVVFAILDLLGVTDWILFPVTTARRKFAKPNGS